MIFRSEIQRALKARQARFIPVALLCWATLHPSFAGWAVDRSFYVNYSASVSDADLLSHKLSIIHPETSVDLRAAHREGNKVLAYLSLGEVASDASYRDAVIEAGIPFAGKNELWNSDLVDPGSDRWKDFVIRHLVPATVDKGFDGLFLDTVDAVDLLARSEPSKREVYAKAMAGLIQGIKAAFPGLKLVMNRGFPIWREVADSIDGVLVESVFHTFDFSSRSYRPVSEQDTKWLMDHVTSIQSAGLPVYILDYVDPGDRRAAVEASEKIASADCYGFLSTPELDGQNLGPLRPVARKIWVLFGRKAHRPEERIRWPADTLTASTLQMPLEWMGYQLEYVEVAQGAIPTGAPLDLKGLILDPGLDLPARKESELVDWLLEQKKENRKILFYYDLPIRDPSNGAKLQEALGIQVDSKGYLPRVTDVSVVAQNKEMGHEEDVFLYDTKFRVVKAPSDAEVWMSVSGVDPGGTKQRFDAVFLADWGGFALQPYLFFERPDSLRFWLLEPFAFLSGVFGDLNCPVPDTTTKNGLRILFSHIDGEGFGQSSTVRRGKRAAEMVLEEIIDRYNLPFTCSIAASEIQAAGKGRVRDETFELVPLARRILQRPNVEAASFSYTMPTSWTAPTTPNKIRDDEDIFDVQREIKGSVDFINSTLLPPDKKVELFLWPGTARPSMEALALLQSLGLPNMNGGETGLSRRYPSLTKVSPVSMSWGSFVQIYCPNQSEAMYRTTLFTGSDTEDALSFEGGYFHVLETFERTDSKRRLKPVNVHFNWYSGGNRMSLTALHLVLEWVTQQDLYPMKASEYVRCVLDSRSTRIFEYLDKPGWVMTNEGDCTTFRLDKAPVSPVLDACVGIASITAVHDSLYLSGTGNARTVVEWSR